MTTSQVTSAAVPYAKVPGSAWYLQYCPEQSSPGIGVVGAPAYRAVRSHRHAPPHLRLRLPEGAAVAVAAE